MSETRKPTRIVVVGSPEARALDQRRRAPLLTRMVRRFKSDFRAQNGYNEQRARRN